MKSRKSSPKLARVCLARFSAAKNCSYSSTPSNRVSGRCRGFTDERASAESTGSAVAAGFDSDLKLSGEEGSTGTEPNTGAAPDMCLTEAVASADIGCAVAEIGSGEPESAENRESCPG